GGNLKHALRSGTSSSKINEATLQSVWELATNYPSATGRLHSRHVAEAIFNSASKIVKITVAPDERQRAFRVDRAIDNVVTSKYWGFAIMLLLLGGVLWLTIIGSNYPSSALSYLLLDQLYPLLKGGAAYIGFPWWLSGF